MQKPELLGSDHVYDGKLITVHRDWLQRGDQTVERELVDDPGSVASVAVNDRPRSSAGAAVPASGRGLPVELPAGLLQAAKRSYPRK